MHEQTGLTALDVAMASHKYDVARLINVRMLRFYQSAFCCLPCSQLLSILVFMHLKQKFRCTLMTQEALCAACYNISFYDSSRLSRSWQTRKRRRVQSLAAAAPPSRTFCKNNAAHHDLHLHFAISC